MTRSWPTCSNTQNTREAIKTMPNESPHRAGHTADLAPPTSSPGYEVRDANIKGIGLFIVGLFTALILTQFAMWALLKAIAGHQGPESTPESPYAESPRDPGYIAPTGKVTPEVALEITEQRRKLNAEEKATLNGENLKDSAGGPVRLSIDRAIDLIANRGLPAPSGPPKTEVEVNSHAGQAAPNAASKPGKTGPEDSPPAPPVEKGTKP